MHRPALFLLLWLVELVNLLDNLLRYCVYVLCYARMHSINLLYVFCAMSRCILFQLLWCCWVGRGLSRLAHGAGIGCPQISTTSTSLTAVRW